nr:uncharacterized protein LOC124816112 [Hydra vulgaris]
MVNKVFRPNFMFVFPISFNTKRSFRLEWIIQFFWLAYSSKEDGAYCLPCTLLGASISNKSGILNLVFEPHQEWGNAVRDSRKHEESCVLNEKSMLSLNALLSRCNSRTFCRHRDDSKYHPDIGESSTQNVGVSNFIELLNFCVDAGDQIIANHLSSSPKLPKTNLLILTGTSGLSLSLNVLNALQEFGLGIQNCRGQGYDGAGCMVGEYKGVASRIKALYYEATFVDCASHRLSLVVAAACQVQKVKSSWPKEMGLAKTLDIQEVRPRLCNVQVYRDNYPTNTVCDYFNHSITSPLIEHLINELDNWFPENGMFGL